MEDQKRKNAVKMCFVLLAVAGTLALAGCSHKKTTVSQRKMTVTGQIFIVTPEADSVKLGDVQVLLIAKSNVANFIRSKEAEIESEIEAKQSQITNASQRKYAAIQAYGDATRAYKAYVRNPTYKTNADYLSLKAQLGEFTQLMKKVQDQDNAVNEKLTVNPGKDVQAYNNLVRQSAFLEDSLDTEKNEVENIQAAIDAMKRSNDDHARQTLAAAESRADKADADLKSLQAALAAYPTVVDCLSGFSSDVSQESRTDPDGKFSFQYPKGESFTIFAAAQRTVSDKTETYYWLVDAPTNAAGAQILLSNDNLATADPDNYFAIKPKGSASVGVTENQP